MTTGTLVYGKCVQDVDAINIYWSGLAPKTILNPDGTTFISIAAESRGEWTHYFFVDGVPTYQFALPTPTFPSCVLDPTLDPVLQFTDGAILGWGVALAMVVAWGITVMRRAI